MQKIKLLLVGFSIATIAMIAEPAMACHPLGVISKKVQNVTTGSALVDANDAKTALQVSTGDTIKYVVTVSNKAVGGDLDAMINVTLNDTLPTGVVFTNGATTISENLGTIKPGKSVTKEYTARVVSKKDGDVITNKACFKGDSTDHKLPQAGCDAAVVKVAVPQTPTAPAPTPAPTAPTQPQLPATLPETGASATIVTVVTLGAAIYAGVYALRRFTTQ